MLIGVLDQEGKIDELSVGNDEKLKGFPNSEQAIRPLE